VFASSAQFAGKEYLLALPCVPGGLVGVLFAGLGWRSSQYVDDFHQLAHNMEYRFPKDVPRPFHASERRRKQVWRGVERFSSSKVLVVGIPVIFTVLFVGLGVASFVMKTSLPPNKARCSCFAADADRQDVGRARAWQGIRDRFI